MTNVVIGKDALGWKDEHKEDLRICGKIIPVSKHPDLQQCISDQTIATYCIKNHCDVKQCSRNLPYSWVWFRLILGAEHSLVFLKGAYGMPLRVLRSS